MSQVTRRGAVKPQLNITPLIDVVFLLIVFFMIVNNIVTDEVPELQLPDLVDPETHQPEGESRVIVNIIPVQEFEPAGENAKFGPGKSEAQVLSRRGEVRAVSIGNREWDVKDGEAMKERFDGRQPPMIMLRADAAVYYNQTLSIMAILQQAMADGLGAEVAAATPIHLVAYMPQD